jgi:hypothetical protein
LAGVTGEAQIKQPRRPKLHLERYNWESFSGK